MKSIEGCKSKFIQFFTLLFIGFCLLGCKNRGKDIIHTEDTFSFAKGADISWFSQMENEGRKFYNSAGKEQDLLVTLKDLGMNTIRLRAWVNPNNGYNNKLDLILKARRAKENGMRVLVCFHYSDTWADPGKQAKPSNWEGLTFSLLKDSMQQYTLDVLNALKSNNITPEWVQIGNETNDGLLWPDGKASTNMASFAQLISVGYQCVKEVFPNTKVIVHVSNGWDKELFKWIFDGLKKNGAKWDVIGMSLYPTPSNWAALNASCLENMKDLVSRYGSEIMVVEIGMSWDQEQACELFIADIISKTKSLPNNKGLGVLYWEPEAYNNWQGYTLGAFDNTGKPMSSLNAFK